MDLHQKRLPAMKKVNSGRRYGWGTFVLVWLLAGSGGAYANDEKPEISPAAMQTGSLLLRMQSGYAVATRLNTAIETEISGPAARVKVRQEFLNDGPNWVEGVYVFPLPDQAAVDRMRLHIGDRFIEGEVREKEQARKEYEQAREAGSKASLVEQQRANMFTTSVANIAPGETVIVEIEYLETLNFDDGIFSLRIPLTITPRYIPGTPLPVNEADRKGSGWSADTTSVTDASAITPPVITKSTDHRVTFSADINAGVELGLIASRYHPVDISAGGAGSDQQRYHVTFRGKRVPLDHDIELIWKPIAADVPRATLFTELVGGQMHGLLMVLPPDDLSVASPPVPREVIFVIDTSGSMHGTSLAQAKQALKLALRGLDTRDRFNVIQFNSYTSALFGASVVADSSNLSRAGRYVAALAADGGTEMAPAIKLALSTPPAESHLRQIVFITDGSVGNEEALFNLIERQLGNSRLFTVGIGSAPNSWFMRKAAEAGRGTFTTISALHEVGEKMQRLFSKLERPQVTDIVIEWPDGSEAESYPSTIPDLYAGEPVQLSTRLENLPRDGDLLVVRGQSARGGWDEQLEIRANVSHAGVGALWGRARIAALMDSERRGAPEVETRSAILQTALDHHLVSKYTSLVAVDKTPVRPAEATPGKEQVPNLLPYGQNHRAIFGFPATATAGEIYRLTGLFFLLAALAMWGLLRVGRVNDTFSPAAN